MSEILIPLTNTQGDDQALGFAAQLGRLSAGHLTLLQPVELPLPAFGPWGDGPLEQMQAAAVESMDRASKKVSSIRSKLAALDVPHIVEVEDGRREQPLTAIAKRAQVFDFSVMACAGETASDRRRQHAMFSSIAFESGRPVFAVPGKYAHQGRFHRVAVAWSSTHESARAAHDFLSLGYDCEVCIVTIAEPAAEDDSGQHLVELLRRKGGRGNFTLIPKKGRAAADALLTHALEIGADLIICGAYGHSRAREWLLGGTTRDLFDRSHVPIFFSR